jgi:hypothetical protein
MAEELEQQNELRQISIEALERHVQMMMEGATD